MNSESFDVNTDIDVDALMTRIRAAAKRRKRSRTNQFSDESPKIVEVGNLLQEIDRSGPLTDAINQIPLRSGSSKRPLELPVKKFLKYLVHWNTKAQSEFNFSVVRSLGLIAQNLQNIQSNLSLLEKKLRESEERASTNLDDQIGIVTATTGELSNKVDTLAASVEEEKNAFTNMDNQIGIIAASTDELSHKVDKLDAALEATSGQTQQTLQRLNGEVSHLISDFDEMKRLFMGKQSIRGSDQLTERLFDYFEFENQFRGSIADIKQRQSVYLEHFRGKGNVLDLGCGRGEFVELLSENEIKVTGVDSNEDMIECCRARGLPVVQADIFNYLAALPDRTLDGITAFQVLEHLNFEQILKVLNLCEQKLLPGGVIITETINTNCPVGLANFYLDPTHIRPVPAQMLRFLFEQGAFRVQSLIFSSGIGDNEKEVSEVSTFEIPPDMSAYQDYAVVAIKL